MTDTSIHIKEVTVTSSAIEKNYSVGKKSEIIDTSILQSNVAGSISNLLLMQSVIFVKSYGAGLSATLSFRGTNANQTSILWNGFKIENPMLGLSDLSLLPVFFCDKVTLTFGGQSAIYGSGSMGGTIELKNTSSFGKGISATVGADYGSFNDLTKYFSSVVSRRKFSCSIKIFKHTSDNDFPFYNNGKQQHQTNSHYRQIGITQNDCWKLNDLNTIVLNGWYEKTERQIPPSITEGESIAKQLDESLRLSGEWNYKKNNFSSSFRSAFFTENLNYENGAKDLSSFKTAIQEVEIFYPVLKKIKMTFGLINTYNTANENSYHQTPHQNISAAFTSINYFNSKIDLSASLNLREEMVNGKANPFTPSFGIEKKFSKYFILKSSLSHNYRLPTFNDLYWVPGGNRNLKPENGYLGDATIEYRNSWKKVEVISSQSVYNSYIKDEIIWLPGILYWSPENITAVHARGFELDQKVNFRISNCIFSMAGKYNYSVATNERTSSAGDASLGKQIIYVPKQTAATTFSFHYKNFFFNYYHSFTDSRFTSKDNRHFIDSYQYANIVASQKIFFKKISVAFNFHINNVWNENYQVIESYPQPLRNYHFGIQISYNRI